MEPKLESTPRLQFTDENNEPYPKWEEKKLGDFLTTADDKPATSVDIQRLLTVGWWGKGVSLSTKGQGFKEGATQFYLRRSGQLIYSKQNLYKGAIDLLSDDFDMTYSSKFNPAFNFKGIPVDKSFVLHYFLRESYYKSLEKHASGTGSKLVGESIFLDLSIPLPSLPEQEKIGEFLSALDDEIEQAERLVSLLSDRKRAYAQRIFNRTLRFHDDNDNPYPEWEEKKLGEVAKIRIGFTPSTSNSSYWEGNNQWLAVSGMNSRHTHQGTKTISDEAAKEKKPFPPGTLLMSFKLSVGKLTITDIPIYTNEAICGFELSNDIQRDYLMYALEISDLTKGSERAVKGITLNKAKIVQIPIPLPSIPEQEKIGSFLSALDDEIDEAKRELELLKEQKKAYAQRIFGV